MAIPYDKVQNLQELIVPAWQNTWPGYDGCSSSLHQMIATSMLGPPITREFYEPTSERVVRDNRHIDGRYNSIIPFRQTPHYAAKYTTKKYLTRRKNGTNGYVIYHQYGVVHKGGGSTCFQSPTSVESIGPFGATWEDVASSYPGTTIAKNAWNMTDVSNAIAQTHNDMVSEALTSYDILTECAEARELPSLVTSVSTDMLHIWKALRGRYNRKDLMYALHVRPRDLLRSPERVLKSIGQRWMEYRYGIMPLVYSYRDAMKTYARGTDVSTHKNTVVKPRVLNPTLPTYAYKWSEIVGDIKIRGTIYQYFSWATASRLSGLGINPIVTLYELIPMSFVFDWFVDVGGYLAAKTSSVQSDVQFACISQKSEYTTKTWVHFLNEDKTVTYGNRLSTPWIGPNPPNAPSMTISRPEEDQLLQEDSVLEYNRWLVSLNSAPLVFKPSLNWKRLTDAAVIALQLLTASYKLK